MFDVENKCIVKSKNKHDLILFVFDIFYINHNVNYCFE